jgi:hypothetical protein
VSKHDIEYFRQRLRQGGVSGDDPFFDAKLVKRGFELQHPEQLCWPKNRSGESASIVELMAEAVQLPGQRGANPDGACLCGCRREHRHNVCQTIRNPYGLRFEVVYFWSNACKSNWNRERIGGQACGL